MTKKEISDIIAAILFTKDVEKEENAVDNLTQIEIAKYLYDYAKLVQLMLAYPDKNIKDLFIENLKLEGREEDATEEYYLNTIKVAYIFTMLKIFSIGEDYTMKQKNNFIDNNLLDITFIRSKITGNLSSISNKAILQSIRNAFNHTEEGNELYKISKDCQKITFYLTKPTTMQIPLDISDFYLIINSIEDITQTFNYFQFNKPNVSSVNEYIKKFEITRKCFLKKLDLNDMKDFLDMDNNGESEAKKQNILSPYKSTTKNIIISKKQRSLIAEHIYNALKNKIISGNEVVDNIEDIMSVFLTKVLPIPALKIFNYQFDSILLNYALSTDTSYNGLYSLVHANLSPINNIDKREKFFYNIFKTYFNDKEEKITYASLLYTEYVLNVFGKDNEEIKVGVKKVETKNLRNSLVHSRWYPNKDKVCFFDALPKIDTETDYNWQQELNLKDVYNFCSKLLNEKMPKKENKTFRKLRKKY